MATTRVEASRASTEIILRAGRMPIASMPHPARIEIGAIGLAKEAASPLPFPAPWLSLEREETKCVDGGAR